MSEIGTYSQNHVAPLNLTGVLAGLTNNQKVSVRIEHGQIKLSKVGRVKVKTRRLVEGMIKTVTVSKTGDIGRLDFFVACKQLSCRSRCLQTKK